MELTYLNILYIALTLFVVAIWIMLTLILIKLNKILWTVHKVTDLVEKVWLAVWAYKQIPDALKEKIKSFVKKKKNKKTSS